MQKPQPGAIRLLNYVKIHPKIYKTTQHIDEVFASKSRNAQSKYDLPVDPIPLRRPRV